jgi:thioredoxin 1
MTLREFTTAVFETEVLQSEIPVLIDFWAPWCGPCRALAPVIEKVAAEFEGRIIVGKLNVDEESAIAAKYSIMSIPTLLLFNKGQVVEQIVGLTNIDKIKEKLNSIG